VIAVLGMHRSGTSALAGSLQQRGMFLGTHSARNRHNPRGNRENPDVARLNEEVLEASGGSWRAPPPRVEWQVAHLDRAREILAGYAGRRVWGFKDPRTVLTVDGWLALVPDLQMVGVFRHPAQVARSLARRASTASAGSPLAQPVEDPISLWRVYNERLLELHRGHSFPVLSFDDDADILARKLDRVAEELALDEPSREEPFFTAELRRTEAGPEELPPGVSALYEELRALSL
jgi:hypothetical protein